jgi:biopolymer transport protein TolR
MVAAPMMTAGVPIDLPSSAAAAMPNQARPVTVAVTPEGAVFIDETPVAETELVSQLNALGVNGAEDRIFLRGDTSANYGAVMRVMGRLSAGGYSKIGLITQPEP